MHVDVKSNGYSGVARIIHGSLKESKRLEIIHDGYDNTILFIEQQRGLAS